jgi:hypothetical protein
MSYLRGLNRVVANLNQEIRNIEGRTLRGLLIAIAHVRKEMDTVMPMIPIGPTAGQVADLKKQGIYREQGTGNLRASWFAIPVNLPAGPAVICGFSANYAVYVHEMIGAVHWTRPGSGPKFFQSALRRNQDKILQIIWEKAKVPG